MSKKKTTKKPAPKPAGEGRLGRFVIAIKVVVVLAVFGGAAAGFAWVDGRAGEIVAGESPEIEVAWLSVLEGGEPSAWPPVEQQSAILSGCYAALSDVQSEHGPLGTGALVAVERAMLASGWVLDAGRVSRARGGKIVVEPEWLTPAAVVRGDAFDYLISADRRPMPIHYRAGTTGWKAILGARRPPSEQWLGDGLAEPLDDPGVDAALRVLGLLTESSGIDQVEAIDAGDPSRLVLLTDRGSRVVWGSATDEYKPGDVGDEVKLERLRYFRTSADEGYRIDAGLPEIDISREKWIVNPSGG